MFAWLRASDPTEMLWHVAFYRFCRALCVVASRVFYKLRIEGRENVPETGGLLIVSNHQSHLDPVFVGVGVGRRNMASIARAGLFKNPLLRLLLRGLGSISLKQDEGDAGAIRAAIGELKKGRAMLIFPEGSRSPDGQVHEFKRGTWLLLSRSGCTVLPAAVEGAFNAWPRTRSVPHLFGHRCAVAFGKPIPFEDLKRLGAEAGLEMLEARVNDLRLKLQQTGTPLKSPSVLQPAAAPPPPAES